MRELLFGLKSFAYISIFPTYTHVAEVAAYIRSMTSLEFLTIKLLPDADRVMPMLEACGRHIDINDPWNEFETCLALIADVSKYLGAPKHDVHSGSLRRLKIEDVLVEGIRAAIESRMWMHLVKDNPRWAFGGNGLWHNVV
jgi:hypothetical protein